MYKGTKNNTTKAGCGLIFKLFFKVYLSNQNIPTYDKFITLFLSMGYFSFPFLFQRWYCGRLSHMGECTAGRHDVKLLTLYFSSLFWWLQYYMTASLFFPHTLGRRACPVPGMGAVTKGIVRNIYFSCCVLLIFPFYLFWTCKLVFCTFDVHNIASAEKIGCVFWTPVLNVFNALETLTTRNDN